MVQSASDSPLRIDREGPIAWVTVNRPHAHNALNLDVWRGLAAAIGELGDDPATRVVILRGAGERAFISGADIREFDRVRGDADAARVYDDLSEATWRALEEAPKPVIAMINGLCYGGGVSVAASCDIRIAGESARFAIPALRLGLAYPVVAVDRLVRLIGPGSAADLLLTGRAIDAAEALRIGLVQRVVPDADLEEAVREAGCAAADGAPLTLAAHKLEIGQSMSHGRDRRPIDEALRRCFESEDYREGVRAFLEKRPPRFTGR